MRIALAGDLRAFWPEYLAHHSHPLNRALHYLADMTVAAGALTALVLGRPWLALIGGALGLALVVVGHRMVEGNAPLVFRHPVLATLCNVRMLWHAMKNTL